MSKVEKEPYKTAGKAYNASKPEQTEKYLADKKWWNEKQQHYTKCSRAMLNPHQPTLRQTRSAVELMVADERVRENQTLPAFAAAATEAVRTASPTKRAKYAAAADAGAAALAPLQEQASIWGTPEKRTGVVSAARLDEALCAAREHAEWDSPGVGSVPSPYPSPAPARVFDMDAVHREYKGKLNRN